jgi:hypothetical protein
MAWSVRASASRGSAAGRPRGLGAPASAPASRARRYSITWLEYRSSRRCTAPFSPDGAASYSATTSSLCFAVNVRRRAFSGTSGSGRSCSSPPYRPASPVTRTRSGAVMGIQKMVSIPPSGKSVITGGGRLTTA